MEEVKIKEAVIQNNFKSKILAPSISTVSLNIESGKIINIDIIDEPFCPKNVFVKTTVKPVEHPENTQPDFVAAKLHTLSQDRHDSGYQSASPLSSFTETCLGDYSHSKIKSKEIIENINKQIQYLEEIIVRKDDITSSSELSIFKNVKRDKRHTRGPKPTKIKLTARKK